MSLFVSVPLVSRICPSDTYRVWKSGQCLRVDTTLMGFEQMTWQRGNRSFIFKGQGDREAFYLQPYPPSLFCFNTILSPGYSHLHKTYFGHISKLKDLSSTYGVLFIPFDSSLLTHNSDSNALVMEVDHDRQLVFCETLPCLPSSPSSRRQSTAVSLLGILQPSDEQVAARLSAPVVTTQLDTRNIAFER